jgi:hypothetical protein
LFYIVDVAGNLYRTEKTVLDIYEPTGTIDYVFRVCYIDYVEQKEFNGEEDEKIYFDPKIIDPRISYGRHFEIIIEL